jgi:acetylornithine deacetylase/succinyl-diaminopimelate desuccinylase-like protein
MRRIEEALDEMRKTDPTLEVEVKVEEHWEAATTDPKHPFIGAAVNAVKEATQIALDLGASTAPSDVRWLIHEAGIPTCKLGFSSETADRDERQNLDDYLKMTKSYATIILNLLY